MEMRAIAPIAETKSLGNKKEDQNNGLVKES